MRPKAFFTHNLINQVIHCRTILDYLHVFRSVSIALQFLPYYDVFFENFFHIKLTHVQIDDFLLPTKRQVHWLQEKAENDNVWLPKKRTSHCKFHSIIESL